MFGDQKFEELIFVFELVRSCFDFMLFQYDGVLVAIIIQSLICVFLMQLQYCLVHCFWEC